MKTRIHAFAGSIALLCILCFWLSTLITELWFSQTEITAVKGYIVYGMWILIPALIITGGSGFALSKSPAGWRTGQFIIRRKKQRMPLIALNGLLVLLPSALYLHLKASAGEFDSLFTVIQGLELTAGMINLALLSINFHDGLRLTGKFKA